MRRLPSSRVVWINVVGVVVAVLVALFGGALRSRPAVTEAWAQAPGAPTAVPSELLAPVASTAPTASAAPALDPIDLAIAPNGGVPHHPSGTPYRSPFAKPNADKPVRVKVGL